MSGVTQGVKFKPFFAVESEDHLPSGSVDSPLLTGTRHQSRTTFTKHQLNDVLQSRRS